MTPDEPVDDLFDDLEVSWLRETDLVDEWTDPTPAPEPPQTVGAAGEPEAKPEPASTPEPDHGLHALAPEPAPEAAWTPVPAAEPAREPAWTPEPVAELFPETEPLPTPESAPDFWRDSYPDLAVPDAPHPVLESTPSEPIPVDVVPTYEPAAHEPAPFEPAPFEPVLYEPVRYERPVLEPEAVAEPVYVESAQPDGSRAVAPLIVKEEPVLTRARRTPKTKPRRSPHVRQRRSALALVSLVVALGVGISVVLISVIGAAVFVIQHALN